MIEHIAPADRAMQLQLLALALYDGAATAHQVRPEARRWLQLAAAYHAAALRLDSDRADRAGRDMVLAAPIDGVKPAQQCLVASVVAFQREKLRRNRELAFLRLNEADQELALQLAAILRLASALEQSGVREIGIEALGRQMMVVVSGESAAAAVEQAQTHADRWRKTIGALVLRSAEPGEVVAPVLSDGVTQLLFNVELPPHIESDKLNGDEPAAEGARRMLRRVFEKMLARETDVYDDKDIEDVHQMRVATRKLRASLQIVEPLFDRTLIRDFRRKLQRVAQSLGGVRDYDVFLLDLRGYRDRLPESERPLLDPLITAAEQRRATHRADLLDDLQGRRYTRFKRTFAEFLTTPGAGVVNESRTGVPPRVRDCAGSMIWQRYEQWRAFEALFPPAEDEVLHQARIAGKRLRYTLEFFADALGPRADELLDPLVALQENLGDFQDGVVAREHIRNLRMESDPGAQQYLVERSASREQHLAAFPQFWDKVSRSTYRRRLFEAIIRM